MNTAIRWAVTVLLVLHGLIHLMGFSKEWKLADIKQLTGQTLVPLSEPMSRMFGLVWLIACLVFLGAAAALLLHSNAWRIWTLGGVVLSQLLIVLWWKDARFGTVANALLLIVVLLPLLSRRPNP
jgi:uncharacterized protein YjeT (DUF2065 family)